MPIKIFLAIKTRPERVKEICRKLRKFREVSEAYIVTKGQYDIIAAIKVHSLDRYRVFAINQIGNIDGITDFVSFLVATFIDDDS